MLCPAAAAPMVISWQVPGYRNVRRGMRCEVVVLSRSPGFSKLTGVTDAYIPELDIFVGRYPLLNKR